MTRRGEGGLRRQRWFYRSGWKHVPASVHNPPEWEAQRDVAEWLDSHPVTAGRWWHPDASAWRSSSQARWAKILGMKAGIPDVLVCAPPHLEGRTWGGLALELKRCHGGRLSPAQRHWLEVWSSLGWFAVVCRGSEEATELLELAYPEALPVLLPPPGASSAQRRAAATALLSLPDPPYIDDVARRCAMDWRTVDALRRALPSS